MKNRVVLDVLPPERSSVSDSVWDVYSRCCSQRHLKRERTPLRGERVRHLDLGAFASSWFYLLSDTTEGQDTLEWLQKGLSPSLREVGAGSCLWLSTDWQEMFITDTPPPQGT